MLQTYIKRVETGGAWIEVNKEMIKEFLVIDINSLSLENKKQLLRLFDKVHQMEFPSLIVQLQEPFPVREAIDRAFLTIFGFTEEASTQLISALYKKLSKDLSQLEKLAWDLSNISLFSVIVLMVAKTHFYCFSSDYLSWGTKRRFKIHSGIEFELYSITKGA